MQDIEGRAKSALRQCLEEAPFLRIDEDAISPQNTVADVDLHLVLNTDHDRLSLVGEIESNGQPRYAHAAANQLSRTLREVPDAYGVFIAPFISSRSAEICREAGIGYVDFAGNCHLAFRQILIHKDGRPNPYAEKRTLKSLYAPKSERVLRVLLQSGPREWKVQELADEAGVSLGLVSNVRNLLADMEWGKAETIGFALTRPFERLEDWSENYNLRRNPVNEFYAMLDPAELEYRLGEICAQNEVAYALTGFSGAARLASMVRYQRAMAYVDGDVEALRSRLGIQSVASGANLILLTPYDEGVFYSAQEKDGLRTVSPIQVYLDLKGFRGRGEEAARRFSTK